VSATLPNPPTVGPDVRAVQASVSCEALEGGLEVLHALAPEWSRLCQEGCCNEPFYRPEWFAAYLRAFLADKKVLFVTARRNGQLCAVLPLLAGRANYYGVPARVLRVPANDHSPRFDVIHRSDSELDEVLKAIWQCLRDRGGWDLIELREVPQGGAAEWLLQAAQQEGYPTGQWESIPCPYIDLAGAAGSLDAILARTTGKFRANLRHRTRRLAARGPVKLVRVDRADPAVLERFYRLEAAGWKGREGSAIACNADVRAFYDGLAREAEQLGWLSLYALECGDATVAMHYGLTCGGRYFVLKLAYEESYRECAPGHLLLREVVGDCLKRGLAEFDFAGGWQDWKAEWTALTKRLFWNYIFDKGVVGRMAHALKFRLVPLMRRRSASPAAPSGETE